MIDPSVCIFFQKWSLAESNLRRKRANSFRHLANPWWIENGEATTKRFGWTWESICERIEECIVGAILADDSFVSIYFGTYLRVYSRIDSGNWSHIYFGSRSALCLVFFLLTKTKGTRGAELFGKSLNCSRDSNNFNKTLKKRLPTNQDQFSKMI